MKSKILYKKTSTGKIQQWRIWVIGSTIHSECGQVDGKKTLSEDEILKGKNIGRANETTKETQAIAEAKSKFLKKLKSGYVRDIEEARKGNTDKVITGGWVAMKAESFEDFEHKIEYPCAIQPKLDGIRGCNDKGTLYTYTQKEITSVPHVTAAINGNKIMLASDTDGEMYNHKYKDDFDSIVSIIQKKKKVAKNYATMQYHIYDINIDAPFINRYEHLVELSKSWRTDDPFVLVETLIIKNREELVAQYAKYLDLGYEGAMVRNLNSPYKDKKARSKDLLKMKLFEDAEFRIVGIKEGKGKYKDNIGSFICEIDDEHGVRQFSCKPKGKVDYWRGVYKDGSWEGSMLTVKFQGYTKKNRVPRIPTGKILRDMDY